MCPQECFSIYKFSFSAYPLLKRIGPLATPQHHLPYLPLLTCCLYQKRIKSYLSVLVVIPCPKSLVNTFWSSLGSTLSLIENTTIDPLDLWVIKKHFLAPLSGSVALLVSEAGKETFTFCVLFLFCYYYILSLWTTLLSVRCLWGTAVVVIPKVYPKVSGIKGYP